MKNLLSTLLLFTLCAVPAAWASPKAIILGTTTSTQDSGLLDILVPLFEKESGIKVKTISVGDRKSVV